jgi:hypothetical protein
MGKYSKKGWERRKKLREGYSEFFMKHVASINNGRCCCAECGTRLKGHVSEIAHILPKGAFPSVATNDDNVIYLCGMYSERQCHTNFDNRGLDYIRNMNIFPHAAKQFTLLIPYISEQISYKILEKYGES